MNFQIKRVNFNFKLAHYYIVILILNNKSVNINGNKITYSVKKSNKAKYVRLKINLDGEIHLIVPKFVSISHAEKLMFSKNNLIIKNYQNIQNKLRKFYFLGNELEIVTGNNNLRQSKSPLIFDNKLLILNTNKVENIRKLYNEWLRTQAKSYIPRRVEYFSDKFGFIYKKVIIRGQKTRWGSCSTNGTLSFNYKLMYFNNKVIDYVIVHELCHLKEMNHSDRFWKLVEAIMPDYKIHKHQLGLFLN